MHRHLIDLRLVLAFNYNPKLLYHVFFRVVKVRQLYWEVEGVNELLCFGFNAIREVHKVLIHHECFLRVVLFQGRKSFKNLYDMYIVDFVHLYEVFEEHEY